MRLLSALWTCVLLATPVGVLAGDVHPIHVYPCPKADKAPRLDGRLDEACWKRAPVVSGFTLFPARATANPQTSFRVVHDDEALYFGIVCDEPLAPKLTKGHPGARDGKSAFRTECIELFIDPHHDHNEYYQLAIGLPGTLYDARAYDSSWNSRMRVATRLGKTSWTLELALPTAEMGLERLGPGMVIGFNVCRDREVGPERQWSQWAIVDGGFHDPVRFAHLALSVEPKALGALGREFRKGGREGPIHIFAAGGFANVAYIALERKALDELDKVIGELKAIMRAEKSPVVVAELEKRIAAVQAEVKPIRAKLASARSLNAAEWARIDHTLKALTNRLGDAVLTTRIEALLKAI